jgi:hypothetical protein
VIFVTEWPKGEFVSNWPHSVGQNHFFVKMLFNRDYFIQKCFQKILHSLQVRNSVPCQQFGGLVIPSGLPAVQSTSRSDDVSYRPDAHQSKASSVQTFPCVEKFRIAPACIRPDISAARPDDSQCLTSFRISFQNTDMGR